MTNTIEAERGESAAARTQPRAETVLHALIVDDHALVRLGLKYLLLNEFKSVAVSEAENAEKGLELVRKQAWDLVLLDLAMPDCGGLETLKHILKLRPRTPVLVLSLHSEDYFAVRALKEGAAGYLTKNLSSGDIIHAVKKAFAGQKYVSVSLAEKLALNLGNCGQGKPHEILSARENQVLRLLGSGKSVKEIGFELGLSGRTVSTYRARLLEKMNLGGNAEIIRYVLLNKLVE